jgi:hypothetical protein
LKILKAFLNLSKTNFSYGKEILAIDNWFYRKLQIYYLGNTKKILSKVRHWCLFLANYIIFNINKYSWKLSSFD